MIGRVTTTFHPRGIFVQEVSAVINGDVYYLAKYTINTQNQQIRDALVALGWTPPNMERIELRSKEPRTQQQGDKP